ncbi:hypothetical protein [Flavobacterium cerinum]|uniref:Yip1 domain-containing protein n=1 Tax=Flavobacterium cerinum TaxID=2502784 RepID=A0A3S3U269_9FLAO|nr:hypothetical protein [Flavobacterium cerinum]RWX02435.1 hypothetical protein EPI11_04235 [Flavobacterium cerinum]
MKKLLLNPFEKYGELQLLAVGIILTVAGSILAFYCNARFDGVIDLHFGEGLILSDPFIDNAINIVSLFIFLFILGLIINTKTRIIDVVTTILIARVPFYLLSLVNCTNIMVRIQNNIDPANLYNITFSTLEMITLLVFGLVTILFLIWFVVLLYNGFKTATNIKQTSHKVMFGIAILLAEALSKIILFIL